MNFDPLQSEYFCLGVGLRQPESERSFTFLNCSCYIEWHELGFVTMSTSKQAQLVSFLETDLAIPMAAIALGLRRCEPVNDFLPMTLWQYGLISLDQLAKIFDWMETA
jgi:Protein of unknown function (DUF2949)